MARDLRKYATSSTFIKYARYMRRSVNNPKVYLYVEDDLDIVFWRKIVEPHSTSYEFEISVYKNLTGKSISGKDYMLKCVQDNILQLSSCVMCCVDADYDLIIDVPGKYSNLIRNNAYIIHTQWYSVENLKCFPLKQYNNIAYSVSLTNANICNDFQECLTALSQELSTLILFTILDKKKSLGIFTVKNLKSFVCKFTMFSPELTITESFKTAIRNKENELKTPIDDNKDEYVKIKRTLSSMGYSPDNYYCIMQGHTLLENIASEMVCAVSKPLRNEWFKNKMVEDKRQNKLTAQHYANCTGVNTTDQNSLKNRIKSMFRDYYGFEQTEAYTAIQRQIERALARQRL